MKKKIISAAVLMLTMTLLAATACALKDCGSESAHRYTSWQTKTSATCTRQGHQFRYCRNCDHWEQKDLPRPPHTPGEWTVILEPTCTHHGREETYCTVCGDRMRRTTPALPHTDGDMTVEKQATCTADGRGTSICSVCGHKTV